MSEDKAEQTLSISGSNYWLNEPVYTILGDFPAADVNDEDDHFELRAKAGPIYDVLRHPDTSTPMAVAIYGRWGVGKTTSMQWIDHRISEWKNIGNSDNKVNTHSMWFFPWKYQTKEDVWRGLLAEVILSCLKIENLDRKRYLSVIKDFGCFLGSSFISLVANAKFGVGGDNSPKFELNSNAIAEIRDHFEKYYSPQNAFSNEFEKTFESWMGKILGKNERLIIFIDDLDRCMPEIALQVLESLKLYLNISNTIFVIGVDKFVIEELVKEHYKTLGLDEEKSRQYLSKIFTVEVDINPNDVHISNFSDHILNNNAIWRKLPKSHDKIFRSVITSMADRSPREVKRIINSAILAGAGENFLSKEIGTDSIKISFAEGVQIHLLSKILSDQYHHSYLLMQNIGVEFFDKWSNLVRKDGNVPINIVIPRNFDAILKKFNESDGTDITADSEFEEAINKIPPQYREFLEDRRFDGLHHLLQDKHIGSLVRLPFPSHALARRSTMHPVSPRKIIYEAAARELGMALDRFSSEYSGEVRTLQLTGYDLEELDALCDFPNLRRLYLTGAKVGNLLPIAKLVELEELDLSGVPVVDLSPLSELKDLRRLQLEDTLVEDLSPLSNLFQLQDLAAEKTRVRDLSPIAGLTNLRRLNLEGTEITDLSYLRDLTKLRVLNLDNCRNVMDISPVAELVNLESFLIPDTNVIDLSPVKKLNRLKSIALDGSPVRDLTPLMALENLKSVSVRRSNVLRKDIENFRRSMDSNLDVQFSRKEV